MRLKPEKIEQLSELVYDTLAKLESEEKLKLSGERDAIVFAIKNVITEDLKAEEQLEVEAREILEAHEGELRRSGVSFDQALRKMKQKLARDRGMVL